MKYILLLSIVFISLFSCEKNKKSKNINNLEKEHVIQTPLDFFDFLEKKSNDNYRLKLVNNPKHFQITLNNFKDVNKMMFEDLIFEREAVFQDNKSATKVYVREWIFKDSTVSKKVEYTINEPTREVIINDQIFIIDTIKQPYFTYRKDDKLYVFYVKTVRDSKYVMYFKNLLDRYFPAGDGN